MAISALGCPITFALIVSPIADPAHLSHNGFKFSLETVRLLISVSWLFFTLTLGLSIFTYNQSFYNQLKVGGPPPPSSFYYRWADMVMNTLDVLCMGAFLMIALAAASYVPVVGWLASVAPQNTPNCVNLAQAFSGIGGIVAPLIGSFVFFGFDNEERALQNVQWVYMSIAIFVFILAGVFILAEIPEMTDADMAL
ncbi:hypothetical protein QC764_500200 [Podospora pseudoanserina]|uniref:Uncharacterized protein n=1 Tax=Podospora pseudoanserina TaxID=2609844 RepID=A0ABR0I5K6_9PEZI|nr:hypothetical protein QC764_500200 [Podospora pseudoanserina]